MSELKLAASEGDFILAGEKTDQDLIEAGKALVHKAEMTTRELGNWFNEVKGSRGGDRKPKNQVSTVETCLSAREICEACGISYSTATQYSAVVTLFPTEASQRGLSWTVCAALLPAYNYWLNNGHEQVARRNLADLIGYAVAGQAYRADIDPDYIYRGPWGVADAKRQVAFITGKQISVANKQIDGVKPAVISAVEKAVMGLPKKKADSILKAVSVGIAHETRKLQDAFSDEVNKKAEEIARQRTEELYAAGERLREQAKRDAMIAANRRKGLPSLMSKSEFRLLLNVLHPDRAPEERRDRFAEAFNMIKQLEEGTSWDE